MNASHRKPLGRPIQQQNSMPTDQQIRMSASHLFMEKGFNNVSMNEVAEHCGVTKATIYYYYPTKTDLFVSSMVATLAQVNQRICDILDLPGSFKDRLLKITEKYLRIPQAHVTGMLEQVQHHLSTSQHQQLTNQENALYETLQEAFDKAAANNEIMCEDSRVTAYIYVAMLQAGQRQYGYDQKLFHNEKEAAEYIVHFLWRGIHV